jgi:hypothetical protein
MSSDKTIKIQIESGKTSTQTGGGGVGGGGKSPEKKTTEELAALTLAREKDRKEVKKQIDQQKAQADSLDGMRAKLRLMQSEFDSMGGRGSSAWKKAQSELNAFNRKVLEVEGNTGRFGRNVANYFDKAQKAVGGFIGQFALGNVIGNFFTSAISNIRDFVSGSAQEFAKAEHSMKSLKFAVTEVGSGTEEGFEKLDKLAGKLMGIVDDEAIKDAMRTMINYGFSVNQVYDAMPTLLDTAAQSGMDLQEVVEKVTRGTEGQTKGLKILGAGIKDTGDKTENFNLIMAKLSKFQGATQEQLQTTEGRLKSLDIQLKESQETLGKSTIKWQLFWAGFKIEALEAVDSTMSGIKTLYNFIFDKTQYAVDSVNKIGDQVEISSNKEIELIKQLAKEKKKTNE